MSPRLAFAIETAVKAGRGTLAHFQTGAAVDLKADASPVTVADRDAERLIREEIGRFYPNEPILGEEEGSEGIGDNCWIIDPIDGTKSFISGVPLYATLLSYEELGKPLIGVCYLPALDELLYAEVGFGAYWNGRQAKVSSKGELKGAVVSSGGHRSMDQLDHMPSFLRLAERTMATRTWSDAYGHALVATGRIEAMVDPTVSRWDISAMKVIVEEAGGKVTDFRNGDPLALQKHGKLEAISSNGLVHAELLEALRS